MTRGIREHVWAIIRMRCGSWRRKRTCALIDLNAMSGKFYERLGASAAEKAFAPGDKTHHNDFGSYELAKIMVEGIRQSRTRAGEASAMTTLFLIGDSTVHNGNGTGGNGQWGWGDLLQPYFNAAQLTVRNMALGGRSSRTFVTEGHWEKTLAMLQPDDFVMMQFGHNDGGALDDASRARGSIKGIGEESREIENPILKRHETVHSYGWYLRKYIAETRAKQAWPLVCSPVPRKIWRDGKVARGDQYAGWAREVALAAKVPFVDLAETIAKRYDALGAERVDPPVRG